MGNLKIKTDPKLLAFAALLVLVTAALIAHGDVSFKEGAAFIAGALALPGLFGKTQDEPPPPPNGGEIPVVNTPITSTHDTALGSR